MGDLKDCHHASDSDDHKRSSKTKRSGSNDRNQKDDRRRRHHSSSENDDRFSRRTKHSPSISYEPKGRNSKKTAIETKIKREENSDDSDANDKETKPKIKSHVVKVE